MNILEILASYWWIIAIVISLACYKLVFRLLGIIIVPEDRIGLVTKKFVLFGDKKELPPGRIIATDGEAGFQAQTLAPGIYFWYWLWQYEIKLQPFTIVKEGEIALIVAKDGAELGTGRILARRVECDIFQDAVGFMRNGGQKGRQSSFITAGVYRINTLLFDIIFAPMVSITENMVGIVTTLDGQPIEPGNIAGKIVDGHSLFQDADAFLNNGGNKGLQQQVILAGSYFLNPWFVQIQQIKMTSIPIGHVGVVISYVGEEGEDLTGKEFGHGNIVSRGHKGVWMEPLGPGMYPINTFIMKIELVPTTNLVLNWAAARTESHNLDAHLSTITVRSRDGFPFNLDVSQIIHIPTTEAPKVIARFGNMQNLVGQVLEPTIGNYFRNSAQKSDVIEFLHSRSERQSDAKGHINKVLDQYNVNGVDTLIGDIAPPADLMKTLTDRKIAGEQKMTYETQREAQETRQKLEKETAIAEMQKELVKADQGVTIAERTADAAVKKATGEAEGVKIAAGADAEKIKVTADAEAHRTTIIGEAEAKRIKAIGEATADAHKLAVGAMGAENYTTMKVTEAIGTNKINVMPEILIMGNGDNASSPIGALLGMQMLEQIGKRSSLSDKKEVSPTPTHEVIIPDTTVIVKK